MEKIYDKTKKKHKPKKRQHFTWLRYITITLVVTATVALLLINMYIPVKYIAAYMVVRDLPQADCVQVTFFDFDDGESTLITLPDKRTILIDGGKGSYSSEQKLLRALNTKGIDTIDYLFLTSFRDSRMGGLVDIAKYKEIKNFFTPNITIDTNDSYEKLLKELDRQGTHIEINSFGKGIKGDDYLFAILSPPADVYSDSSPYYDLNLEQSSANINAASAVYWLEYSGVKLLLLGDSTEAVQNRILRQYETDMENFKVLGSQIDFIAFDIVKIAYGGRTTNYSSRLMTMSAFSTAVITGDSATVKTLSSLIGDSRQILSTKQSGDITITIDGGTFA